ncbi:MAG: hypothetical protein B6U88_02930, partial [Candidatus Aenigmarchaeota archaeon ex4484_56]
LSACVITLIILVLTEFLIHFSLIHIAVKRADITEEILPDALRLISSNLRSGIMPEKAFLLSARPEFGPLNKQIKEAGKELIVGKKLEDAFRKIPEKINSKVLRRTIKLIEEGILKGGNIAPLLDGLADDIKSSMMLKKEIKAQVTSYIMFIFLAIGIGTPVLYAASSFLIETLIGLGEIMPTESFSTGMINLSISSINLSHDFLNYYFNILMAISSIFGGILIGLIQDGREVSGVKYIPVLLLLNFGIFYILKYVVLASFAVF